MKSFNIVVCASGGGGNFRSLIKYQCDYGYHISLLIVDRECPTIKIAKENGISYSVLEDCPHRYEFNCFSRISTDYTQMDL